MSFDPKRALVVFNCNDAQLSQVDLFTESIRSESGGAYDGRIMAVSTKLSPPAKDWLASKGVEIFERPLNFLLDWPGAQVVANTIYHEERYQSGTSVSSSLWTGSQQAGLAASGETKMAELLRSAVAEAPVTDRSINLERFGNKRFSKLNVIPALEAVAGEVDWVLFCDTDLLFQGPVASIFAQLPNERIGGGVEGIKIGPGTGIFTKDGYYRELFPEEAESLALPREEFNIGFLAGRLRDMIEVWRAARALMLDERYLPLYQRHWHEQDFFRLLRAQRPELFHLFDDGVVYHSCGNLYEFVEQTAPLEFVARRDGRKPLVMHFAGGVWRHFNTVRTIYEASEFRLFHAAGLIGSKDPLQYSEAFAVQDQGPLLAFARDCLRGRDRATITELGGFFGAFTLKLWLEFSDSLDVHIDLVDSCVIEHDWEWQLVHGNRSSFAVHTYFGLSQSEIISQRFSGISSVNVFLKQRAKDYRPKGPLTLALLNRIKHPSLMQDDIGRVWPSLEEGGWLVVNRFEKSPAALRQSVLKSLCAFQAEIAEARLSIAGGFFAVRKQEG